MAKQVADSDVFVIPPASGRGPEDRAQAVEGLEFIARLMDGVFEVPGTKLRFGFDALLGLIPGLGDTVSSLVSLYILQEAQRRGVSKVTMTRMAANIAVDYVVGVVPVVGDAFDVYWQANQRNVELLKRHLVANPAEQRQAKREDRWFFFALAAVLLVMLAGSIAIAWLVVSAIWALLSK